MRGLRSPKNQQSNEIPLLIDSKNGEKQKKKPWMLEGLVWPVKFSSDPTILAISSEQQQHSIKKKISDCSHQKENQSRENQDSILKKIKTQESQLWKVQSKSRILQIQMKRTPQKL